MVKHWEDVLAGEWGIAASLQLLHGEFDLNFKVNCVDDHNYLLKVMRPGCVASFVDMQCEALSFIQNSSIDVSVPLVVDSTGGEPCIIVKDPQGNDRIVWLVQYISGTTYADFTPKSFELIENIGNSVAQLNLALQGLEHPHLHRDIRWNLSYGIWISSYLELFKNLRRRQIISTVIADFQQITEALMSLPFVAVHNDINDFNLLISASLEGQPTVAGIIDFGDMCSAPRICELAIAGAYIVLDHSEPELALTALLAGFNRVVPLSEAELALLFPLLRMRLAVSIVTSMLASVHKPDDPYVVVSQAAAWRFLENTTLNPILLDCRLRIACGLPATTSWLRVLAFLDSTRMHFSPIVKFDLATAPVESLSVEHAVLPMNPFHICNREAAELNPISINSEPVWMGYYNEPRLIYTAPAFCPGPWKASNRRTVHLGVDIFCCAGTDIHAPLDGTVHELCVTEDHLDYGGMVVLYHTLPEGEKFYTLYGHLNPASVNVLAVGQKITAGEVFCELGDRSVNGGWVPHLHFQLALIPGNSGNDWPGVCDPEQTDLYNALYPNPAALLNLPDARIAYSPSDIAAVREQRQTSFSSNVKLSYRQPVLFVRGWKHHLFDQWARPYLDAYNNVPHVGHANSRIQAVAAKQLRQINSNTRYLHPSQSAFAQKIVGKMPAGLSVCFFVNSGSEANELALRLVRAHTGGKDIITLDHGYHGNTTGAIDISAYKFNAPGGVGKPDWVHLVDIPDVYRGRYRRGEEDCARHYADQVDQCISRIRERHGKLAGFIAETFPSVGGQIIPPKGYLKRVYQKIRAAGGICIADEVQTGLGRLGEFYFGFEHQEVIPDIVVLGKPIGNGHPLGVLVTTRAIADSFAQGPEFFSTFGGSTLACVIGKEVLDIVDQQGLQENARLMGEKLIQGLQQLQNKFPQIGDVRGIGLFVGVELVCDSDLLTPATRLASYVVNRMRDFRVLIGLEGPNNNILKIRPPLTIESDDIEMILFHLELILSETAASEGCVSGASGSTYTG